MSLNICTNSISSIKRIKQPFFNLNMTIPLKKFKTAICQIYTFYFFSLSLKQKVFCDGIRTTPLGGQEVCCTEGVGRVEFTRSGCMKGMFWGRGTRVPKGWIKCAQRRWISQHSNWKFH